MPRSSRVFDAGPSAPIRSSARQFAPVGQRRMPGAPSSDADRLHGSLDADGAGGAARLEASAVERAALHDVSQIRLADLRAVEGERALAGADRSHPRRTCARRRPSLCAGKRCPAAADASSRCEARLSANTRKSQSRARRRGGSKRVRDERHAARRTNARDQQAGHRGADDAAPTMTTSKSGAAGSSQGDAARELRDPRPPAAAPVLESATTRPSREAAGRKPGAQVAQPLHRAAEDSGTCAPSVGERDDPAAISRAPRIVPGQRLAAPASKPASCRARR